MVNNPHKLYAGEMAAVSSDECPQVFDFVSTGLPTSWGKCYWWQMMFIVINETAVLNIVDGEELKN